MSATLAPNKEERKKCWAAKDSFWECLDKNNDDVSKCKHLRQEFEASCTRTWVKYFDRRKDYLKYKDKIETSGFEPVDDKNK